MSKSRIRTVLEMIKFEHSVFALPFALVGALLAARAAGGLPTWRQIAVDRRGDGGSALRRDDHEPHRRHRIRPPQSAHRKPRAPERASFRWASRGRSQSPRRRCWSSRRGSLNPLALKLSPVALAILFFYSYTKRFTSWSHFVLGFCLGISPAAAWIAIRGSLDWRMLILCAAVTLWVGGFDVLYACQDVEFDKAGRPVFHPEEIWHRAGAADRARACTL